MSTHYDRHGYKYTKTFGGWVTKAYSGMLQRTKKHNHKEVDFSKEEFKVWVLIQPNYQELFDEWEIADYETRYIPTPDRLDDNLGYYFDNMQLLSYEDNRAKQTLTQFKGVLQLRAGEVVGNFVSVDEASRNTGVHRGGIAKCCKGEQQKSGGFAWKYKESENGL